MRHYNEISTQEFNTKLKRVEQAEGKARRARGEGARASGCLTRWGGEDTTRRRNLIRACGGPESWNRTLPSIQSSREPEQCRRGKHRHPCAGQTQCGRNTAGAPHTQRYLSEASRPPQQDWTELANLNKRSPPPACARAEIRHRRDGKQKPDKQRELLQKGLVQQIKIPQGNTNNTGRGL